VGEAWFTFMGTKTSEITEISLKHHHAVHEVFCVCVRFWCAGNLHRIMGLCSLEETNSDHYVIIQGVVKGTENLGQSTFFARNEGELCKKN
jgi:hypothetical protein